jgi:hypothetical protein
MGVAVLLWASQESHTWTQLRYTREAVKNCSLDLKLRLNYLMWSLSHNPSSQELNEKEKKKTIKLWVVNSQPTARAASKSKSDPEVMFSHHGQSYYSFLSQEMSIQHMEIGIFLVY